MQHAYRIILPALFLLASTVCSAQKCVYSISPSTHHNWVDVSAQFRTNEANLGYDSTILRFSDKIQIASETLNDTQDLVTRSFIKFDIYTTSSNSCGWNVGNLKLRFTGNQLDAHNVDSGANDFIVSRIIEPWGEDTLRWKTPPTNAQYRMPQTTTTDAVYVKGSSIGNENFIVNIKDFLNYWRNNPGTNYGVEIRLANESGKRSLTFTSSEFSTPSVRPDVYAETLNCSLNTAYAGKDVYLCRGESTTFDGKYGEFFEWTGGPLSDRFIADPVATPTASGYYYLTTTVGDCKTTDSLYIRLMEFPNLVTVDDQEICEGDSVTLTSSGALNYQWSPPVNIILPGLESPIVFPRTTTTYKLVANIGNRCSTTREITVVVKPAAKTDAGNDVKICEDDEIELLASGADTYEWIKGTSSLSQTNIANPVATPTQTTTYYVRGDNGSCPTTDSIIVEVVPKFTVNAGVDDSVCFGKTAYLSAQRGFNYYRWSQVPANSLPNNIFIADPYVENMRSTTTFTLYVEDVNGCSAEDDVVIVVNQLPNLEIGRDTFVCLGEEVLIEVERLQGNGPYRFQWRDGKGDTTGVGFVNNSQSKDITVNGFKDTTYVYTLTVTDKFGCVSLDDIGVSMLPGLEIETYGDTVVCKGTKVEIGVDGGKFFKWTGPNIIGTDTRRSISVIPETVTTYTVEAGNGEACSDGVLGYVTVNVIEPPTAYIRSIESEREVDTLFICKGRYADLVASGATYYVWNIDSVVGDSLSYRLVTDSARISLFGILEGGPGAPDCPGPVDDILLLLDPHDSCLSKVYVPNAFSPNNDGLNDSMTVSTSLIRDYKITIFNRWGQELFTSTNPKEGWTGMFNGALVPEGVYFYVVEAFGEDEESRSARGTVTVIY